MRAYDNDHPKVLENNRDEKKLEYHSSINGIGSRAEWNLHPATRTST